MVVEGEVEIVVSNDKCDEISLARLGPGQFFGEVELTQGGNSIAGVRSSANGAELAILPRDVFFNLIDGSSLTRKAIQEVAESRVTEHNRRKTDC